jgi:hypothetical protein
MVMVVVAILVVVANGSTPGGRFLKTANGFRTGGGGKNVGRFRRFSHFLPASTPSVCSLQKKSPARRPSLLISDKQNVEKMV